MRNAAWAIALAWVALSVASNAAEPPRKREPPVFPVGSVPEDDLGKDINGNKVHISDYHGKVVILSFWGSWCEPCRKELPILAGLVKRVGPDHLQVLAINHRDEAEPFKYVVN